MTKKDYELIADILQDCEKDFAPSMVYGQIKVSKRNIAYQFARKLSLNNPRFNREKFLTACGITD